MPNPDRQFDDSDDSKVGNWITVVMLFIFIVIPLIWLIYGVITGTIKQSPASNQPSCRYSGDEYICDEN